MKNTLKFQKSFLNSQLFEATQKLITDEELSCQVRQLFLLKHLDESVLTVETNILKQERHVTMETSVPETDAQLLVLRSLSLNAILTILCTQLVLLLVETAFEIV